LVKIWASKAKGEESDDDEHESVVVEAPRAEKEIIAGME
jgi:hypothetical protein